MDMAQGNHFFHGATTHTGCMKDPCFKPGFFHGLPGLAHPRRGGAVHRNGDDLLA